MTPSDDLQDLYADVSACLLAIVNALNDSGATTKQALAESFQERLLALQPEGRSTELSPHPFVLLRHLATELDRTPPR